MSESPTPPFGSLDFLYVPSADVAADASYFRDVLGGTPVFSIDGMGARVAAIRLAENAPTVLLTDHLDGDETIFVYRVEDLRAALRTLESNGWEREGTFEIPHGPCCSFRTPGGQRISLYQLTRPEAAASFDGRFDF